MTTWSDLYLRTSLSDTGPDKRAGALGSPDIIPYGLVPVDASIFTTRESYDRDEGKNLNQNETNFLYMRAKNSSTSESKSGQAYLALSNPAVILWPGPGKWELMENSLGQNYSEIKNVKPGEVGATIYPFQYIPKEAGHRCLVGWISTPDHQIGEPPKISDATKLAEFLVKNPNYAHRNVEVIAGSTGKVTRTESYTSGDQTAKVTFGLECTNCNGFGVSFVSGTPIPDSDKFIELKETIVAGNERITYTKDYIIPNAYQTMINYSYDKKDNTQSDFEISFVSYLDVPPNHYLYPYATAQEDIGVPKELIVNDNRKILLGSIGVKGIEKI